MINNKRSVWVAWFSICHLFRLWKLQSTVKIVHIHSPYWNLGHYRQLLYDAALGIPFPPPTHTQTRLCVYTRMSLCVCVRAYESTCVCMRMYVTALIQFAEKNYISPYMCVMTLIQFIEKEYISWALNPPPIKGCGLWIFLFYIRRLKQIYMGISNSLTWATTLYHGIWRMLDMTRFMETYI